MAKDFISARSGRRADLLCILRGAENLEEVELLPWARRRQGEPGCAWGDPPGLQGLPRRQALIRNDFQHVICLYILTHNHTDIK